MSGVTIRTTLTLPVELHQQLRMQAVREGSSLSELVVQALTKKPAQSRVSMAVTASQLLDQYPDQTASKASKLVIADRTR